MNSTDEEIKELLTELTGSSEPMKMTKEKMTISGTSHVLLDVLKIVKDMSQHGNLATEVNFRPPGTVLFDHLRIDTKSDMIHFSCVFALLSMITVIIGQLVKRCRRVCRRTRRLLCVSFG